MLSEDYSSKFATMIVQIPKLMFIFDVVKPSGESQFVPIYKTASITEMVQVIGKQLDIENIDSILFMNTETKNFYNVPLSNSVSIESTINGFNSDSATQNVVQPIYENDYMFKVFRIYLPNSQDCVLSVDKSSDDAN
jgi:hypothetical protein